MSADVVAIIEAAYQRADSDLAWLQGIADATLPALGQGRSVNAYTYDARNIAEFRVPACASAGSPTVGAREIEGLVRGGPEPLMKTAYEPGPPMFASVLFASGGASGRRPRAALTNLGISDLVGLRGSDWSGLGVIVTIEYPRKVRLPPAQVRVLSCVRAHLAAGYRLRQARVATEDADAVLDPSARLLHLADARVEPHAQRLRRGADRRIHARGALRRDDPEAAVALWRAMIEGEWTLVDHVDTDGKRLILAKRNRPEVGEPGALGLRDRQVAAYAAAGFPLKHIAYELGLSNASVSEHLKSALRKLRLRDRAELIQVLGGAAPPHEPK